MYVLFICESKRSCWQLVKHLEQQGCCCWFAWTPAEIRALLEQHEFRLVLSARPVTEQSPLMELLKGSHRIVFYSVPVENSCLWFQAIPEVVCELRVTALRPSEFTNTLNDLIARSNQDGPCIAPAA